MRDWHQCRRLELEAIFRPAARFYARPENRQWSDGLERSDADTILINAADFTACA
jgi:hypothetical protein